MSILLSEHISKNKCGQHWQNGN